MKVGITGGIGSGKSTVSDYLRSKGLIIIDADQISRDIVKKDSPVLMKLVETFGSDIIDQEGNLRRKYLAEIVFSNKEKKEFLDGIMMKEITNIIEEKFKMAAGLTVFLDAPLLFEAGLSNKVDVTILITASKEARLSRVALRDNVEKSHVEERMNNQMSDDEKIKLADYVIENNGSKEELYLEIDKALKKI
ncbi:MAG: dephospho-CoA kinase [Anaerovoracaceae bacterium]